MADRNVVHEWSRCGGGGTAGIPDEAEILQHAIDKLGAERAAGLSWRKAAAALGFVDVHLSGNFWQRPDGTREPVAYEPHEELPGRRGRRLPDLPQDGRTQHEHTLPCEESWSRVDCR